MQPSILTARRLCSTARELATKSLSRESDAGHEVDIQGLVTGLQTLETSLVELHHTISSSTQAGTVTALPGLDDLCASLLACKTLLDPESTLGEEAPRDHQLPTAPTLTWSEPSPGMATNLSKIQAQINASYERMQQWTATLFALEVETIRNILSRTTMSSASPINDNDVINISTPPRQLLQRNSSGAQLGDSFELPSPFQLAQSPSAAPPFPNQPQVPVFADLPISEDHDNAQQAVYIQQDDDSNGLHAPGPVMQLIRSRSNQNLHQPPAEQ